MGLIRDQILILQFYLLLKVLFFPIPPDVMIAPMVIAKKNDYLKIFLIATLFSSLGGILGYFIGSYFFYLGMVVVEFYNYEEKVINLKNNLSEGSGLYIWLATLFLAGFTPLPFKVFTITSGMIGFNLFIFLIICLFSRGLRFFIVSYLSFKLGDTFNAFMKTKVAMWSSILGIVIVLILSVIYFTTK